VERDQREKALREQVEPLATRLTALEHGQRQVQADLAVFSERIHDLQVRLGARDEAVVGRVELVVSEVMHRAEAGHARLTTDLQHTLDLVTRQQRELAALTRSLADPEALAVGEPTVPLTPRRSPYQLFAELERGTREQVAARVAAYLHLLEGLDPFVDLGCGRGEFLELAAQAGLAAYGVDDDAAAVEGCLARGLKAEQADALEHLRSLDAGSVGALLSTHVVEHLPAEALWPFLAEVERVLRPGGLAIIETPNPSTLITHLASFWRDPTHVRPVPAPALWFAARQAGLVVLDTWYGHLPEERLAPSGLQDDADPKVSALARSHDALVARLNDLLLGPQDYAVLLRKP
jgi:O-antigen chain-terminating methyltransferase